MYAKKEIRMPVGVVKRFQKKSTLKRQHAVDNEKDSPSRYQVMLGAGAPSASQAMVASIPSRAVTFCGGLIITGEEAGRERDTCIVRDAKVALGRVSSSDWDGIGPVSIGL